MFFPAQVTNINHHERLKMKKKQIWRVILSTFTLAVQSRKSSSVSKKNLTISASVTTWFNSFVERRGRGLFTRNMIYWRNSGHNCESPVASCRLSVVAAFVNRCWSRFVVRSVWRGKCHKKSPNVAWSWFVLKAGYIRKQEISIR